MTANDPSASFRHEVTIAWGWCDPAGIVFYPRYFEMFDSATSHMLSTAGGMTTYDLMRHYGVAGWPMVKTGAEFHIPSRFGDRLVVETAVVRFGRSSFDVEHKVWRGEKLAIVAHEARVWAARSPDDPDRLRGVPFPADLAEQLRRGPQSTGLSASE